ncbi:TPA: hypothetical protein GRI96_25530 [Vibrio parahaemolyticus]|uniref:hypothetical protein n=1 Tax=Vibrio parahaemolyticus TaxID=670 RepID=UPI00064AFEC4|nr:hypothetical protein [Vibrio parahaemolyticus]EGR1985705.1 hypothetical protein [Vibrio parahaemolyticus]EII3443213.1 hypothetical protein [Vibrio parahaemolyticus]ELA7843114.1 hypothetical protein [Vibrio parahaemolyticus]OXD26665.1 hypothetical protein CA164_23270 [Vibrio parahaemolyticus]HAS6808502.1 hypothetical protein [Vibrio parahaemolyticus]
MEKCKWELIETLKNSNSYESKVLTEVLESLAHGESLDESVIMNGVLGYFDKMQSNCDSIAQGQLSILSTVCMFQPNLARELFERPMQALYYLGLESMDDIKRYLEWFIIYDEPYLGRGSDESYMWLNGFLANGTDVIQQAFINMYEKEYNDGGVKS